MAEAVVDLAGQPLALGLTGDLVVQLGDLVALLVRGIAGGVPLEAGALPQTEADGDAEQDSCQ